MYRGFDCRYLGFFSVQIISVQILGVLGVLGTVATPCLVLAAILKVEDKCRTSVLSILSALGTGERERERERDRQRD